jgi:N-acetylmuramoyl-L-alanine amidase
MSKLVAICPGHGPETPGKRTPCFPDGTFMHENTFNRVVADKLEIHLKRCGFKTLMTTPRDIDNPLKARTDLANNAKADFYISIHANANTGVWGSAHGVDTFYFSTHPESKKAADIIHSFLIRGTPLVDRRVQSADFHVLRETHMPAVLVECGFMDNLVEAKLLLTDAYRAECAIEIARGICKYLGVVFVAEEVKPKMDPVDANKVIEFLKAAYGVTPDHEAQTEIKRLANELRKASGQPIQ